MSSRTTIGHSSPFDRCHVETVTASSPSIAGRVVELVLLDLLEVRVQSPRRRRPAFARREASISDRVRAYRFDVRQPLAGITPRPAQLPEPERLDGLVERLDRAGERDFVARALTSRRTSSTVSKRFHPAFSSEGSSAASSHALASSG